MGIYLFKKEEEKGRSQIKGDWDGNSALITHMCIY